MSPRISPQSREIQDTLRALRRAARKALELGIKTGTPVYVMKDGKIVDLTRKQTKNSRKRPTSKAR
jgi:tryptophan synthase alpha subunit